MVLVSLDVRQSINNVRFYSHTIGKDFLESKMVIHNELWVQERCASVEDVVVGLNVKHFDFRTFVFGFNRILNDKTHVAKWQSHVFLSKQPIMIVVIKSMTFVESKVVGLNFIRIHLIVIVESFDYGTIH